MLLSVMGYMTGCEKKPDQNEEELLIEDTTEIVATSPLNKKIPAENVPEALETSEKKNEESREAEEPITQKSDPQPIPDAYYIFQNSDGAKYELAVDKKSISLQPNDKPILLINFFDIDEAASTAQIPYLLKLQKSYSDTLVILGIPTNIGLNDVTLREFVQKYQLDYYLCDTKKSDTLVRVFSDILGVKLTAPTTLLYSNGALESVYEGAVPIEMITHDILSIDKE